MTAGSEPLSRRELIHLCGCTARRAGGTEGSDVRQRSVRVEAGCRCTEGCSRVSPVIALTVHCRPKMSTQQWTKPYHIRSHPQDLAFGQHFGTLMLLLQIPLPKRLGRHHFSEEKPRAATKAATSVPGQAPPERLVSPVEPQPHDPGGIAERRSSTPVSSMLVNGNLTSRRLLPQDRVEEAIDLLRARYMRTPSHTNAVFELGDSRKARRGLPANSAGRNPRGPASSWPLRPGGVSSITSASAAGGRVVQFQKADGEGNSCATTKANVSRPPPRTTTWSKPSAGAGTHQAASGVCAGRSTKASPGWSTFVRWKSHRNQGDLVQRARPPPPREDAWRSRFPSGDAASGTRNDSGAWRRQGNVPGHDDRGRGWESCPSRGGLSVQVSRGHVANRAL